MEKGKKEQREWTSMQSLAFGQRAKEEAKMDSKTYFD